jgi:MarR family transcriptional regulator, lower aerobic nicotinate degradation pathway regulator
MIYPRLSCGQLIEAKNVHLHLLHNEISQLRIVATLDSPFSTAPMKTPRHIGPAPNSVDPDGEFPLGPPEYFFYLLFQAARQRDLFFDRELSPVGLNLAQWRSLAIIRRLDSCTMTALARFSAVERTTLTRAVDQLVDRGIVDRSTPDRDRRQINLSLTEAGKTVYSEAVAILKARNAAVLSEVDPRRLRDATRVLQEVLLKLTGEGDLANDLLNFGAAPPPVE